MSMFDTYKPANALRCPVCAKPLERWQGKDGPSALFVWTEGSAAPTGQDVDDDIALPPEERESVRLPPAFTLYSYDCPDHRPIEATGLCTRGTWSDTVVRPFKA